MSESKGRRYHHIIPVFYQKYWAREVGSEQVFIFDNRYDTQVRVSNVGNIAVERDYYDRNSEDYFGDMIEGPASTAMLKLKNEGLGGIDDADRFAIAMFAVNLEYRVKDAERALRSIVRKIIGDNVDMYRRFLFIDEGFVPITNGIDILFVPTSSVINERANARMMQKHSVRKALPNLHEDLVMEAKRHAKSDWGIWNVSGELSLILGDNPIIYEEPGDGGPSMIYLACGSDSVLVMYCRGIGDGGAFDMSDRAVHYFNMKMVGQSDLIIGNNERIVDLYRNGFSRRKEWNPISSDRYIFERFS